MKYACIAAVALAGATLSTTYATAHGSNCSYWNAPYCESAHHAQHGNWGPPVFQPQPQFWPVYPGCGFNHGYGYGQNYGYSTPYQDDYWATPPITPAPDTPTEPAPDPVAETPPAPEPVVPYDACSAVSVPGNCTCDGTSGNAVLTCERVVTR